MTEAFDGWFDSNFLDPDGGASHLPDWFRGDMQKAWDAGRAAQASWMPIGTAPRDGSLVLLFNILGNRHIGRWGMRYLGDPGPEAWCNDGKYICQPTHWQPLPEGPSVPSAECK